MEKEEVFGSNILYINKESLKFDDIKLTKIHINIQTRGYYVKVGGVNNLEIDFIAETQKKRKYIQVSYNLSDNQTKEREFGNLMKIKDNYEKIVISMDKYFTEDYPFTSAYIYR